MCSSPDWQHIQYEEEFSQRYRNIVIDLWQMLIEYISSDNLDGVIELFKRSRDATEEAASFDTTYSDILKTTVLNHLPEVQNRLEHLHVQSFMDHNAEASIPSYSQNIVNSPVQVTREPNMHYTSIPSTKYLKAEPSSTTRETARGANGDQHSELRKQLIENTKKDPGRGGLDTIAGLSQAKQLITEAVIMPMKHPQLFTGGRRPWNRVLLYGPPGTGKTKLVYAVAAEVSAQLYSVSSADLLSSWVGESEKLICELFQYVNSREERAVIFFDEIDGMCRKRSSGEQEHTRRLKTELLSQIEKINPNVFLLAATNCPWDIDSAFLRRFQRRVFIPLPDREARLEIFKSHAQECKLNLSDDDWQRLLDQTEGYTGSDLSSLTNNALFEPVRDLQKTTHWRLQPDGMWATAPSNYPRAVKRSLEQLPPLKIVARDIVITDFIKAIAETSKTVSRKDLEEYNEFNEKYG